MVMGWKATGVMRQDLKWWGKWGYKEWGRTHLDIGDRWELGPDARGEGGEGEEGGDAEGHTARHGIGVEPEGHPWDHYDEDGGDVSLQDVVTVLATQLKGHLQGAEITCERKRRRRGIV